MAPNRLDEQIFEYHKIFSVCNETCKIIKVLPSQECSYMVAYSISEKRQPVIQHITMYTYIKE